MKTLSLLVILSLASVRFAIASWTEESRRIESEQISFWESKIAATKQNPLATQWSELCLGLRNMGYRHSQDGRSPSVDSTYEKLQTEILSNPGHARYFFDRINNRRKSSKDFLSDSEYHQYCVELQDTLPHLPSPQTVLVLGEMLESTADVPTPEQWLELLQSQERGARVAWYYPSALAGQTLLSMKIREFPQGTGPNAVFTKYDIEPYRAWWQEVKEGRKTFSFKGQAVEYRFKPDGTWDTIPIANPPDDASGRRDAGTVDRPLKRSPSTPVTENKVPGEWSWAWIWVAVIAGLSGFFWLQMRKKLQ